MNYISELTASHLHRNGCKIPAAYFDLLQTATEIHSPPHSKAWYGKLYRQQACQAQWFADSLILNAFEEGQGARQVWQFSQQIDQPEFQELTRNHAIDESRHSKMFATLLDLLFPTQLERETRAKVKTFSPGYKPGDLPESKSTVKLELVDDRSMMDTLIQINLLEIRALILQLLLKSVLKAYAQPQDLAVVSRMCERFIYDETQHIAYSAQCIAKYWESGNLAQEIQHERDWLQSQMIYRQSTVNQMFLAEAEGQTELAMSQLSAAMLRQVVV